MSRRSRNRARGFTLIEVMIAITIMGVLALICWRALDSVANSNQRLRQADDRADLEEGRQVITRCQQQPHRQHRSDKAIADQHPGDLGAGEGERRAPGRVGGHLATQPDRTQ